MSGPEHEGEVAADEVVKALHNGFRAGLLAPLFVIALVAGLAAFVLGSTVAPLCLFWAGYKKLRGKA